MAEKKISLDILAESHIPSDLLTPSLGSNYGLDGYPDMEYGAGVLEGVLEPDNLPAPALPTGLSKGAAGEMDLSGVMQEAPVTDLSWLDSGQLDLDRLPETPESIPELEQAWGYSTNGVEAPHLRDLAHARQAAAPTRKANARTLTKVAQHAMRRSIEGHDIEEIVRSSLESMGSEMGRVANILRKVREDHGLAGNVFIRSAAYPGWGAGKWKAHAKKYASSAKYIVVSASEKDAAWVQEGRCAYTGKTVVTEVPWKQAHAHYAPRLEATGRKVASGDHRQSLQTAFLSQPRKVEADTGYLPTHETPDQRITRSEARRQFANLQVDKKVFDRSDRELARRQQKAAGYISQLVGKGLIQAPDRDRLMASGKSPEDMVRAAVRLASASRNRSYEKPVFSRVANTSKTARSVLAGQIKQATSWVRKTMTEGFAGKDLDSLIHNRFAGSLLEAAESEISQIRAAHEGLSGFLYVDAGAYASETGAKGCESGAMKHRANQIPNVRAMDRCATCTLARVREDGTRKCGAYNKTLVDAADLSGPEMEPLKKANIKSVEMSDAEATASLFAPSYDAREFGLVNANLEGFALEELPETEKMASIFFDGWNI